MMEIMTIFIDYMMKYLIGFMTFYDENTDKNYNSIFDDPDNINNTIRG